jgi:antitoxin component of RelBE/YafQ-DinJ toxin-antitoxin module
VTRHRKTKEVMVQSTMRIPHALWQRINKVADMKRLSMAQTVERALLFYCYVNGELPFDFEESSPVQEIEWKLALDEMKRAEGKKRAEQKRRGVRT